VTAAVGQREKRSSLRSFSARALLGGFLVVVLAGCGREPDPRPLDPQALLESFQWWDNRDWDWYRDHIPFFDSPDPELNATYYYRWEVLTKHLVYGSPRTGYTFTEFIDRPFWSGAYGAISCPLGHQAYEIRWLKDRRIIQDFARYWFETPGAEPRSYSNWYGDAMWATYQVLGDREFLARVFPHMEAQVAGWTAERWDPDHGMYRWVGAWDGMETNINSRLTDDPFGGGEGYRPTLNSYLFADLMALSRAASLLGEAEKASDYGARALALKERVQTELWDPEREFFFHQFAFDEKDGIEAGSLTYETGPYAGDPHGRELLGYVPWQFNLPDAGYESAWRFLMDPDYFWAPFGPTGVEQGDPQFLVSPRCCVWSGNAWPYATTQTLVALANLLNNYDQDVVDKEDYLRLLQTYSRSHRSNGRPYIAEAADPFTGSWSGHNTFYHSEHYLHSGFVDLVITGLMGIRPQAGVSLVVNPLVPDHWAYFALQGVDYHGHELSLVWDKDGSRYHAGAGFSLFLNGEEVIRTPTVQRLEIQVPEARIPPDRPGLHNHAVSNDPGFFPTPTASSSHPTAPPFYAVDGNRWYHPSPPNRWVSGGGPDPQWFQVDFGTDRDLTRVDLYFLDDGNGPEVEVTGQEEGSGFPQNPGAPGRPILPPQEYQVLAWDPNPGTWVAIPDQSRRPERPAGRRANSVRFPNLSTSRIRVVLQPEPHARVGLTELEAWGPGQHPFPEPIDPVGNLVFNGIPGAPPRVTASFTGPGSEAAQVQDGRVAPTRYSRNRWTAQDSPNPQDWLEVDFGGSVQVDRVEVFLLADGRSLTPPRSWKVEWWNGEGWAQVGPTDLRPADPTPWAWNTLAFPPVETAKLRVVFSHGQPGFTGVSELRAWKP